MARLTNDEADKVFESNLRRQEGILMQRLNSNFNQLSRDIQRLMESYDFVGAATAVELNDVVLAQILLDAYERGNKVGSRMAARDLEEDESLAEEAALLALLLWRTGTAEEMSRKINRTTKKIYDKILSTVTEDLTERDQSGVIIRTPTTSEISKEVAKRTKAENKKRAGTIATTESQRGIQEGANKTAEQVDYQVLKQWRSQRDRRVRDTHKRADGQTVPMDGLFKVGKGEGRYPHDSRLPTAETIGCRCYLRFKKVARTP